MSEAREKGLIRQAGEGEQLWFAGGGVFTMKANAADTNGAFILFEDHVVRGKTTPLHLHPNEDELVYLLDGELVAHVGGKETVVKKGGFVLFPKGVAHSFLVTSEKAHLLCMQTPATAESFYRHASDPVTSEADASRPPDLPRLREAAAKSEGIELLGPPPFAR